MSDLLARLPKRRNTAAIILAVLLILLALLNAQYPISSTLLNWTGEEALLPQVRGVFQLVSGLTRPQPKTRPHVPVSHTDVCPFGVNVFLEQEVEPEKRERTLQMISEAGFKWIRQEFPWEDIEIHGQGDIEDRRHEPYRSA